jgi:cation:H+ antiporter
VYAIYFISLFFDSGETLEGEEIAPFLSLTKSWLYLALGLIVVVTSAELTVSAVGKVALALNIEASFIAIIIIGLGTSLPELSISLAAVLKNRHHMSVGNIVGSNVFDTLIPVGIAATISGLHFDEGMLTRELPFLFVLTVLVLLIFARRRGIRMPEAIFILGLYASYVLVKINAL